MPARATADKLHYEDVEIGVSVRFGAKLVTRDEIIEWARAFDPQPFHLDEQAAKASMIGRLCASGWHTCAMLMRMIADDVLARATSLGSPGIDEVKWLEPVAPGDQLWARYVCTAKRTLNSRPEIGLCKIVFELLNQNETVVMSWESNQFLRVRNPEAPA